MLLYLERGIPIIYYGEELGLKEFSLPAIWTTLKIRLFLTLPKRQKSKDIVKLKF